MTLPFIRAITHYLICKLFQTLYRTDNLLFLGDDDLLFNKLLQ